MSYVYVSDYNAYIHIDSGTLVIDYEHSLKHKIPLEQLEGLVVFGNLGISTGVFKELLEREIPTFFLSSKGRFFGYIDSTTHVNIDRQRIQFRKGDDIEFCLNFSKSVIDAKVNNQIVLLRRYNRTRNISNVESIIREIIIQRRRILSAKNLSQLLGIEGICARYYFSGLSHLTNEEFKFKGRSRQPPRDPFNSLLSLGYAMLTNEAYSAVVSKGLSPYAGFLHQDKRGHPALVSDLIEEWRAVIVDSLVLSMIDNSSFKPEDFLNEETRGVFLGRTALKKFIDSFERKIRTETSYLTYIDSKVSFRRAITFQVGSLCKALEENDISLYRPIILR